MSLLHYFFWVFS